MENLFDFIANNPLLVSAWAFTVMMLIFTERQKGGKSASPAEATRMMNKENAVVVDIRAKKEFGSGHIANSLNIPLAEFDRRMSELNAHKEKPIIVVCNMGQTAGTACRKLKTAGFNAVRLSGGMTEWRGQNMPVVAK
ncbi:MAG TPA: rhodanese-like domain-containing protein [Marinobacterium sp.]|nr:rhodanese-like domain-containing protein [Marinobacterium sp.]